MSSAIVNFIILSQMWWRRE